MDKVIIRQNYRSIQYRETENTKANDYKLSTKLKHDLSIRNQHLNQNQKPTLE